MTPQGLRRGSGNRRRFVAFWVADLVLPRGPHDMKKLRRQRLSAKFARLRRALDLSLDPDRPRRLRTRSARHAASLAEQLGLLERPPRCSWCRRRKNLERHHWDYDEPLVVTFLCHDCHFIADGMVETRETA